MAGKGGARPGAGRKPKADEERLRDLLSPYVPDAIEKVVEIMRNGKQQKDQLAAAKLLIEYQFGKPKQQTDLTSGGEKISIPVSSWQ